MFANLRVYDGMAINVTANKISVILNSDFII